MPVLPVAVLLEALGNLLTPGSTILNENYLVWMFSGRYIFQKKSPHTGLLYYKFVYIIYTKTKIYKPMVYKSAIS